MVLVWLEGCSETRSYRVKQGWSFRVHLGRLGHVSITCPTNRGDELLEPEQGAWADLHVASLAGVKRRYEGDYECERDALERVEEHLFASARLVYRGFITHDLATVPKILEERDPEAEGEAYSVSRNPGGLSLGLSMSRRASGWIVYGVWAANGEPKRYEGARRSFFEAYPELADIEAVAKAVGPQRHIPIAAEDAERVLKAFARTPSEDFSFATASWTLGD